MHDTYLIDLSANAAHWWTFAVLLYAVLYGLVMRHFRNRED